MKISKIEGDVKSPGRNWSIDVAEGVNVLCLQGESGGGKTAVANAAQLCLLKTCWIDILGKEIKQGKMIRDRLNGGKDLWAKVHHSKGRGFSSATISSNKFGKVSTSWHDGWKAPHGANLAATLKDILSRTPAKMVNMLVDLVVRNIEASDVRKNVGADEAALEYINGYLSRRGTTPLEALNSAITSLTETHKAVNRDIEPLTAQANSSAVCPTDQRIEDAKRNRDYWTTQLNLCIAASNASNNDDVVNDLTEKLEKAKSKLVQYQTERDSIQGINYEKIEAYEAARALAKYASKHSLPICPLCASKEVRPELPMPQAERFAQIAGEFEGAAERERSKPELKRREALEVSVAATLKEVEGLEIQLTFAKGQVVVAEPKHSYEEASQEKETADEKYDRIIIMKRRYDEQQERMARLEKLVAEKERVAGMVKTLKSVKVDLVDSRFDDFLELTRSFMPAPQHMKGGVLHVNIERREIGFVRNGELHLDPSGSELRTIVIAMALAAGTKMAEPPPVFLDDVGWGVELLEAAMNAWTQYKGFVFVPTTAKVRQSKVGDKVQITKISDITYHLSEQAQPIEHGMGKDQDASSWAERPEDYGTSVFKLAVEAMRVGDEVIITQKIKQGRNHISQEYPAKVTRNNGTNVTATTEEGVAFTISIATGLAPYSKATVLSHIGRCTLKGAYMSALKEFLGYKENFHTSLETAQRLWNNQISADDYMVRVG